jgi:glutamate synthase domain-containing protein 1
VPVDEEHVGTSANRTRPHMRQLFIGAVGDYASDQGAFERKLYVIRRIVELAAGPDFYAPSCSSRTVVWKGMLMASQTRGFFPTSSTRR